MEKILADISFDAPDMPGAQIVVNRELCLAKNGRMRGDQGSEPVYSVPPARCSI